MTAPAAIAGTYHNLRPVMGRKVFQVHVELPIEHMQEFVKAFGAPNPDTWIALARLDLNAVLSSPDPPSQVTTNQPAPATGIPDTVAGAGRVKRKWDEMSPAQQAGILCGHPAFWLFLDGREHTHIQTDEAAAFHVRRICGVASRSEITPHNPDALFAWNNLVQDYRLWRDHPDAGEPW